MACSRTARGSGWAREVAGTRARATRSAARMTTSGHGAERGGCTVGDAGMQVGSWVVRPFDRPTRPRRARASSGRNQGCFPVDLGGAAGGGYEPSCANGGGRDEQRGGAPAGGGGGQRQGGGHAAVRRPPARGRPPPLYLSPTWKQPCRRSKAVSRCRERPCPQGDSSRANVTRGNALRESRIEVDERHPENGIHGRDHGSLLPWLEGKA